MGVGLGAGDDEEQAMADKDGLPGSLLPERLTVIEVDGVFVVASEDDPSDWVACFSQDEHFAARAWAERMAELYNLRGDDERDPDNPPVFLGTHHPL
jgi:hypothetical protein